MRSLRSLALASLLLALAAPLLAQNECSSVTDDPNNPLGNPRNVCNAAVDGTKFFHPILGLLVSGGNPVIGTGKTLGGFPHLSLTARVNATKVDLPDLNYNGQSSTVGISKNTIAPAPLVEGALGLFKGLPGGLLSLDLLASAQLLPADQIDNLTIEGGRRIGSIALGLGFGGRVGVLSGKFPVPALSVSAMRRTIPRIKYGDLADASQDYQYDVNLNATNVRIVASEKLMILNIAAGLGWDKYTGDAAIGYRDPTTGVPNTSIAVNLSNTRTMMFVDASLDFPVVKIVGELGYQSGKDQNLPTTFQGVDDAKGKVFGGAGLRISF